MGHELDVVWNPELERWVVMTFSRETGRVDFPLFVVENEDGTYRPLDDRVLPHVRECSPRSDGEWKTTTQWFKRRFHAQRQLARRMTRYKMLKNARRGYWLRGEAVPNSLRKKIEDARDQLRAYVGLYGEDDSREQAKAIANLLGANRRIVPMTG